jgi:hypothetical protein
LGPKSYENEPVQWRKGRDVLVLEELGLDRPDARHTQKTPPRGLSDKDTRGGGAEKEKEIAPEGQSPRPQPPRLSARPPNPTTPVKTQPTTRAKVPPHHPSYLDFLGITW